MKSNADGSVLTEDVKKEMTPKPNCHWNFLKGCWEEGPRRGTYWDLRYTS